MRPSRRGFLKLLGAGAIGAAAAKALPASALPKVEEIVPGGVSSPPDWAYKPQVFVEGHFEPTTWLPSTIRPPQVKDLNPGEKLTLSVVGFEPRFNDNSRVIHTIAGESYIRPGRIEMSLVLLLRGFLPRNIHPSHQAVRIGVGDRSVQAMINTVATSVDRGYVEQSVEMVVFGDPAVLSDITQAVCLDRRELWLQIEE